MVGATIGGADAVAVTAKVGRDNPESLRQTTGDLVPRRMCERVAVQQQERRAVAAMTQRFTSALERIIRTAPGQYFWLHRRWKHQPKARGLKKAA